MLEEMPHRAGQTSTEGKALRLKLFGFLKGGISRRKAPRTTAKPSTYGGMLLLLSVTQPGRLLTPVGFATLVHTRCAFIVSGAASKNSHQRFDRYNAELNNLDQRCQALLILGP